MTIPEVQGYRFTPEALAIDARTPGISAFMRIRNGADFLEATIRSHIDHFDEIVAVYNQCSDATPAILARLAGEFGPRLRVFHYLDAVHAPGTPGHAATPGDAPTSLVTYSNFALAATRHRIVTKLDDDHLAIAAEVARVVADLRAGRADLGMMHCFSGPNLIRNGAGALALPEADLLSGSGDIGFFALRPDTVFTHDRRFERFARGGLKRRFAGFLYWHLKYLKRGGGFANSLSDENPNGRFARKQQRLAAMPLLSLAEARARLRPGAGDRLAALLREKARLRLARNGAFAPAFPQADLEAALDATVPGWRDLIGARIAGGRE